MLGGVGKRLARDRVRRLYRGVVHILDVALHPHGRRHAPASGEVFDEARERWLAPDVFLFGHLEQELPDAAKVLSDLALDLVQDADRRVGVGLDQVSERLDLEHRGGDGLRQPVVDLHRPAGALLEQDRLHRVAHRGVAACDGALAFRRVRNTHSHASFLPACGLVAKTFGTSALFGRRSGVLDPSGPVLLDRHGSGWGMPGQLSVTSATVGQALRRRRMPDGACGPNKVVSGALNFYPGRKRRALRITETQTPAAARPPTEGGSRWHERSVSTWARRTRSCPCWRPASRS